MFQEIRFIRPKKFSNETEVSYSLLNNYLLNLLFKHEEKYFDSFIRRYSREYGENASRYFKNSRFKWANEYLGMSNQTIDRALPIIFSVLTSDHKNEILERETLIIIKDILNFYIKEINLISKQSKINNLNDLKIRLHSIQSILKNIKNIDSFFVELSDLNKRDNSIIASNIVIKSINFKIERFNKDIKKCLVFFNQEFPPNSIVNYVSSFFNFELDLLNRNLNRSYFTELRPLEFGTVFSNTYGHIIDSFILKESLETYIGNHINISEGLISDIDLEMFYNKYKQLFKQNYVSNVKANFRGLEGYLILNITVSPSSILRKQNLNYYFTAIFFLIFVILLTFGVFSGINFLIKVFFIILILYLLAGINEFLKNIKQNEIIIEKNKFIGYG